MTSQDILVPMEVKALTTDPAADASVVILRNAEDGRVLPIWIGAAEAHAIALELQDLRPPRPLTHDLVISMLKLLEAKVLRVVITDLVESTFLAEILIERQSSLKVVDARPSDAIALALRADAPVFVHERVLDQAKRDERAERLSEDERVKQMLEAFDPEDLGDYTM